MTADTIRRAPAPGPARFAAVLHDVARALDRWLARRQRIAEDRAALATMSDRELADIGVPRASVGPAASGAWMRADFR